MPVLKIKQDGVWKEIAGGSQSNMLIVTLDEETHTASSTSSEIYKHMQDGDNVLLFDTAYCCAPFDIRTDLARFSIVLDTGEIFFYTILEDGSFRLEETSYVFAEEMDAALSQKSQVQIITWEEND